MLAGLRKQLADARLSPSEKKQLEAQIKQLEKEMGID